MVRPLVTCAATVAQCRVTRDYQTCLRHRTSSTRLSGSQLSQIYVNVCADVDEYSAVDQVRVEIWVVADGQNCDTATGKHSTAAINSDDSVTTQDNADGQGVDVYNAGTNNQLQGLGITIYGGKNPLLTWQVGVALTNHCIKSYMSPASAAAALHDQTYLPAWQLKTRQQQYYVSVDQMH